MKNLKKFMGLFLILCLTLCTFAQVSFAKSFTDVASTASYAEAVNVLSELGIISGYEDGTFGPDKTIKRSEAAKIIVAMVNKLATAEGRMGATQFTDVPADHWASGFINVGVTEKFINGMGGDIFKPDGEVTYNQIVKMIVSCLGYNEYATFYGGYPAGYLSIADSKGITKGCSMNGDAAATRAIVAQLVYNALPVPLMEQTEFGTQTTYTIMDGYGETPYKSPFTELGFAKIEGSIVGTSEKEYNGSKCGTDEVVYRFDDAYGNEFWEDYLSKNADKDNYACYTFKFEDGVPVSKYSDAPSEIYVKKLSDDSYTIIDIRPAEEEEKE